MVSSTSFKLVQLVHISTSFKLVQQAGLTLVAGLVLLVHRTSLTLVQYTGGRLTSFKLVQMMSILTSIKLVQHAGPTLR